MMDERCGLKCLIRNKDFREYISAKYLKNTSFTLWKTLLFSCVYMHQNEVIMYPISLRNYEKVISNQVLFNN